MLDTVNELKPEKNREVRHLSLLNLPLFALEQKSFVVAFRNDVHGWLGKHFWLAQLMCLAVRDEVV
jgi:hypothetical protein